MKEQPSFTDPNNTKNPLGNAYSETTISSSETKKENSERKTCSLAKKLIIIIGAAVVIAGVCIVLVFLLKDKGDKDKANPKIKDPISSSSSTNSSSSSSSSSIPPSSSSIPPSSSSSPRSSSSTPPSSSSTPPSSSSISQAPTEILEEPLPLISFGEAQKLMNSKKIEENHKLLNESSESVIESLNVLNETTNSLNPINTNITYSIPDFLDNATDSVSNLVKSDINLYNSKYEELEEKANNLTETVSESMKDLSAPLDNIKEGVNNLIDEFENDTISLSLPLSLINLTDLPETENIDKRRRLAFKKNVEEYKEEVDKLNNQYSMFFEYIKMVTALISQNMAEIPNSVKEINTNLEKSIMDYENLLGKFKKENNNTENHDNLLSIKQSFLDIKNNMNTQKEGIENRINFLEELYKNNTFDLDAFQKETNNIRENITNLSNSIISDINEERKKSGVAPIIMPTQRETASSIIADSIIKSIYRSFRILIDIEIIKQNKIISIIIIINVVEERTSLDLLFIMDITGSMSPYVEEAKRNVIDIINRIVNDCPGIDINLGFIGYRDIEEEVTGDVVDIEFTKNHTDLKDKISNVRAFGGGDLPEDVSWAFEKALNKTWKSNAKFVVFVADAPNHGLKYGGDNRSIPGRRDLEELIKELANNGISLFCMKIYSYITKMLDLFETIYDNYDKTQFQIVDMYSANAFSDVVVNSARNIYTSQRMNDESISFEANKKKLRIYLIEINPILNSITNNELYANNSGHPYVSEYFNQDRELPLKEMKEDLEFASHGNIEIEFVSHIIDNSFPKYKDLIKLKNGKMDYRLDEETYILVSKSEDNPDKGDWYKMIDSPLIKEVGNYIFDYDYFIKKYELDKLRKNNAFDQVWIYGIDPLSTFETIMVGSNSYWINGDPIIKDCKNFMIIAVSISRRDSNLHALGHGFENLISFAFTGDRNFYDKEYDDDTQEKYGKLNEWEKFTLIDSKSKGGNAGVGNIHFPFNGIDDYDYSNTNEVYSNWEYWQNYPNITAVKKKYNNDAWMKFKGNEKLINDTNECQDPDRLYVRFWMYLLPHVDGFTKTGQLNNWWDYFTNCDYVTKVDADNKVINGTLKDKVPISYKVYYRSGSVETIQYASFDDNIEIEGDCVNYYDYELYAVKKGTCFLNIYRDGNFFKLTINVN